jgi:predicted  nucleic acid-binding Zn-ribbon protein
MTKACLLCALGLLAFSAAAQAPVQDTSPREQAIQRSQISAGAAYRELEQAQYEKKLAEQDVLNTQDAFQAAQQRAAELKRQLDAARKVLEAARAKEVQARKRYDAALSSVDRAFEKTPTGKK